MGKKLPRQQVSARLDESGRHLGPTTIYKIEQGTRALDVDDLLALAVALEVSPVDLLVPGVWGDDAVWAAAPCVTMPASRARAWIGGRALLTPITDAADLAERIRWMPAGRARELAKAWSAQPGR
jgi:transcriptional regulator with XRE-family HTH domain